MIGLSSANSKKRQALEYAKELRIKLQDDESKVSILLMGCRTVCKYLDTLEENSWIEQELNGYDLSGFSNFGGQENALPDYRKVNCVYYNQYNSPLIFPDSKTEETLSTFKIPNAITEIETVTNMIITGGPMIDGINKLNSRSSHRIVKAIVTDNHIHAVLSGIRNRIYEFLDNVIQGLEYSGMIEAIFEEVKKEVDSKLVNFCPSAINKLQTAYDDASTSDPESWSHVASSCRRIIKDVADAIFPAQSQPIKVNGKEYIVNESAYINRIIVALRLRSTSQSTLQFNVSMIEYVDSFLRNIQSYSSKGDHGAFTRADASRCVIYTYMVLGDILKYYFESDAVTKVLGNPFDRKEGIQKYNNRGKSPFEELIRGAKNEIIFVSTSHEMIARFKNDIIQEAIENDLSITVVVLHPDSTEVKRKQIIFQITDLSEKIQEALRKLCILKKTVTNTEKLVIKTYDSEVNYSYIVVDPKSDNALIKIEELSGNDPEKRKSYLAYKKDNHKFFSEHWDEIRSLGNLINYECK